jgi:anti-anti-sigma factor
MEERGVRIVFFGEIDTSTCDVVTAAVIDALASPGLRYLCLDLAEARFMDSSGIHALVHCRAQATYSGCRMVVMNPQPIVYRALETSALLQVPAVTSAGAGTAPGGKPGGRCETANGAGRRHGQRPGADATGRWAGGAAPP